MSRKKYLKNDTYTLCLRDCSLQKPMFWWPACLSLLASLGSSKNIETKTFKPQYFINFHLQQRRIWPTTTQNLNSTTAGLQRSIHRMPPSHTVSTTTRCLHGSAILGFVGVWPPTLPLMWASSSLRACWSWWPAACRGRSSPTPPAATHPGSSCWWRHTSACPLGQCFGGADCAHCDSNSARRQTGCSLVSLQEAAARVPEFHPGLPHHC